MKITFVTPTPSLNGGFRVVAAHGDRLRQRGMRSILSRGSLIPLHSAPEYVPCSAGEGGRNESNPTPRIWISSACPFTSSISLGP